MPARPTTASYAPHLDGLRAVAVAAVAWSHWLPDYQFGAPLGAGVHLFFVLSGFLITRILLGLRDEVNRGAAVTRFFARRALRLFPAFYVVLGLAWLADVPLVRETWPWHAAYLSNVYIAGQEAWQAHLSHFWSLAVEQQFYLLWPWVVVWAPSRWLGPVFIACAFAGPAVHLAAASRGVDESFWALAPGGSLDSLAVGALVALWSGTSPPLAGMRVWRRAACAGAIGWLGIFVMEATTGVPLFVRASRQLLQGLVFAWVVAAAAGGLSGLIGRVLSHPVIVAVGRISYGVYLVHAFTPLVIDTVVRRAGLASIETWSPFARAAAAWVAALLLASVLWRTVESPAHRLRQRV